MYAQSGESHLPLVPSSRVTVDLPQKRTPHGRSQPKPKALAVRWGRLPRCMEPFGPHNLRQHDRV